MDIDFIKWMVSMADGWIILNQENDDRIQLPITRNQIEFEELSDSWGKELIYPLLLQRAIEGVNMEEPDVGIIITLCLVEVVHYRDFSNAIKSWNYIDREIGIDDAKESALRYIYEQEEN